MLTDVRRQKLTRKFNVFDADGSGWVDGADFRLVIDRMRAVGGRSVEDRIASLADRYASFWTVLQRLADANGDGRVTLEEWLAFHEAALDQEEAMAEAVPDAPAPTSELTAAIFDIFDTDGDASVSLEEYRRFFEVYGISTQFADEAFAKLDRNGDGRVSRDEFVRAAHEFHFSDDPQAPGNWLFGPF